MSQFNENEIIIKQEPLDIPLDDEENLDEFEEEIRIKTEPEDACCNENAEQEDYTGEEPTGNGSGYIDLMKPGKRMSREEGVRAELTRPLSKDVGDIPIFSDEEESEDFPFITEIPHDLDCASATDSDDSFCEPGCRHLEGDLYDPEEVEEAKMQKITQTHPIQSTSQSTSYKINLPQKPVPSDNIKNSSGVTPNYTIVSEEQDELFGKDGKTIWKTCPLSLSNEEKPSNNLVSFAGTTLNGASAAKEPIDCFKLFFSPQIFASVLNYTNEEINFYQENFQVINKKKDYSYRNDLTINELQAFCGLLILCGATRNNHMPTTALFDSTLCGDRYRAVMSSNRFRFINSRLKFDSRKTRSERLRFDRFALISEVWNILIENCQKNYRPGNYVTIGEQQVGIRGHGGFHMYSPSKSHKDRMKMMLMCDANSNYLCNAIPYTGKGSLAENIPNTSYFVKELVKPIAGSYRLLTGGDWLTSIPLAEDLLAHYKLRYLGTIKKNKRQLPAEFTDKKYKQRTVGSSFFIYRENMTAVSFKSKSNKLVTAISTAHDGAVITSNGKPEIIGKYISTKWGVDTFNQLCRFMNVGLKTRRWAHCFFYNMLNIACINAYVVYVCNYLKVNPNYKHLSRLKFMILLSEQLTAPWMHYRLTLSIPRPLRSVICKCLKLDEKEEMIERVPGVSIGGQKRKYCGFCSTRHRRMSKMMCSWCAVTICGEHHRKMCVSCASKCSNLE